MNKPKALYIHIPFCEHICDYCDFTKLQYFTIFAEPYLKHLKIELDNYQINHQLETIYVGGGTPTSLEDDLFVKLLKIIEPYSHNVKEYTFECNPESLSEYKLLMMKAYGVNRLSIGVESTNDEILKAINRHHTYADVKNAIVRAQKVGFDNTNVDLILGLPGSDLSQLKLDLTNLLSLGIQHISCYSLTVHPNTVFFLKNISEPLSDQSRELYDYVESYLSKNGFVHYEISNWALPGKESHHNMVYWKNEQYYGVGLGASGYVNNIRYTNTKSITEYLKGKTRDIEETVTREDDIEYQIMLNLRTINGLNLSDFKNKFGYDLLEAKEKEINQLIDRKLLRLNNNILSPTYEGMMVLDTIILDLI